MSQIRTPQHMLPLYYASLLSVALEYAAAVYFMMTLAQTFVQIIICLLIAFVVSTYTITMWATVGNLISKGKIVLALIVCVALNAPAFVYDVHGFLGVTSEINHALENNSEIAQSERQLFAAQLSSIKSLSNSQLNPAELAAKNAELTAANNQLLQQKTKCKNQWGNCAKSIQSQIEMNERLILSNDDIAKSNGETVSAISTARNSANAIVSGANDNRKAHEVFKVLSNWMYGNIEHAKAIQGNVLTYSAIFLSLLVMLLPFLANLICFDAIPVQIQNPVLQTGNISSPAPLQNQQPENSQPVEEHEEQEPPAPQSWADRYKSGEVSAWSGIFKGNEQPNAGVTAYSFTAPAMNADALANSATNANAPRYGVSELLTDADAPIANAATETDYFAENIDRLGGFGFQPAKTAPVIHWQPENPAGVEIAGIEEPDAFENTRPAASECVQIDADVRVQTDADAPNADADTNARSVVSLAKTAKTANSTGRGIDSLMEYSDLKNAVMRSNFLLKNDGSLSQNLVEKFMSVGRPKAKRFIERLLEDGVINEKGEVI